MKHLFSWLLKHCLLPIFTALYTQSYFSLNAKSHTGIHKCFFHVPVGIRQMYTTAIKEPTCFGGRENGTKCLMLVFYIQLWNVISDRSRSACVVWGSLLCLPQEASKLRAVRQSHELKYTEELRIPGHPQEKAKCCSIEAVTASSRLQNQAKIISSLCLFRFCNLFS